MDQARSQESGEGIGGEVSERRNRQIGGERRPIPADSDAGHSGAAGGLNAGGRIFDHD
jgi:hypothetical protein